MLANQSLVIITPLFEDWDCLEQLLIGLSDCEDLPRSTRVVIIDDGSITSPDSRIRELATEFEFDLVSLGVNLGHQRAIAVGLVEVSNADDKSPVIVIDSDGEDVPGDCAKLWREHLAHPQEIIVARRESRSEGRVFRAFYVCYRWLFRALTGHRLDFGNFSLLPFEARERLVLMPELWNHYPGTIMKSRLKLRRIQVARGKRFSGRSKMSFVSLVNHGLAGISVFADRAYGRLLVWALLAATLLGSVALGGAIYRLFSGQPLPGWLALSVVAGLIAVLQIIAALGVLSFVTLSFRAQPSIPPFQFASTYVVSRQMATSNEAQA